MKLQRSKKFVVTVGAMALAFGLSSWVASAYLFSIMSPDAVLSAGAGAGATSVGALILLDAHIFYKESHPQFVRQARFWFTIISWAVGALYLVLLALFLSANLLNAVEHLYFREWIFSAIMGILTPGCTGLAMLLSMLRES